jgi:hypothetical protein
VVMTLPRITRDHTLKAPVQFARKTPFSHAARSVICWKKLKKPSYLSFCAWSTLVTVVVGVVVLLVIVAFVVMNGGAEIAGKGLLVSSSSSSLQTTQSVLGPSNHSINDIAQKNVKMNITVGDASSLPVVRFGLIPTEVGVLRYTASIGEADDGAMAILSMAEWIRLMTHDDRTYSESLATAMTTILQVRRSWYQRKRLMPNIPVWYYKYPIICWSWFRWRLWFLKFQLGKLSLVCLLTLSSKDPFHNSYPCYIHLFPVLPFSFFWGSIPCSHRTHPTLHFDLKHPECRGNRSNNVHSSLYWSKIPI